MEFSYLPVAGLVLLTGAAAGLLLGKYIPPLTPEGSRNRMWIATVLCFLVYFALLGYKYRAMQLGAWDFGIYDSLLHNAASGSGLMRDYRGGGYDHFSPLILLLTPFYLIWDSPFWLILFQPLALALAAPLLYFACRRYFPAGNGALLLTLMYLLNPYYSRLALYDFHSEVFFPLFFFAAFLCYARNRFGWMLFFLATAPLLKEDFTIPAAAAGLLLFTRRRTRRHGAAAIAISIFWAVFALKVYFPAILGNDYWHYGRYELIGADFGETRSNLLAFAERFFSISAGKVLISTVLPFALLPLLSRRAFLLLLLPTAAIQLISANDHQQLLISHYGSAVLAAAPIAALWGARSLRAMLRNGGKLRLLHPALAAAAGVTIAVHIGFCDLPLTKFYAYTDRYLAHIHPGILSIPLRNGYWEEMFRKLGHAEDVRVFLDRLPLRPGQQAVCQNELGTQLIRRVSVCDLPELGLGRSRPERPEYFLLDRGNYTGNCDFSGVNRLLRSLQRDPEYRVVASPEGPLAFIRLDALEPRPKENEKVPLHSGK